MSSLNLDLTVSNRDGLCVRVVNEPSPSSLKGNTDGELGRETGRVEEAWIKQPFPARGDVLTGRKEPPWEEVGG